MGVGAAHHETCLAGEREVGEGKRSREDKSNPPATHRMKDKADEGSRFQFLRPTFTSLAVDTLFGRRRGGGGDNLRTEAVRLVTVVPSSEDRLLHRYSKSSTANRRAAASWHAPTRLSRACLRTLEHEANKRVAHPRLPTIHPQARPEASPAEGPPPPIEATGRRQWKAV